ncbi:MAG: PIG-L family deacetylase [Actinomycetales bacterium]|nr:PIG-L family deacetylase [Actinomycetales bacterium]
MPGPTLQAHDRPPLAAPARVLVVTAHPDDVDFGAAGTIAALTAAGVSVSYVIVTDGHQGGEDPSLSREQMRQLRREEQVHAAALVGVTDVRFLGEDDGSVMPTLDLRARLVGEIRRARPDVLITQSPQRNWSRIQASHPDHLAVGESAVQAVYPDARNQFAFPHLLDEGLAPHAVGQVWLMAHPEPTIAIDVTETYPLKLAALTAHTSQTAHVPDLGDRVRGWLAANAALAGMPPGRLAEAFFIADTA